jgi:3-oxoacyl-[acyl-carrier protein] reductase
LNFVDKIAVITGGSRGIGRAIALSFAKNGAHVGILFHDNREEASSVHEEIEALGRRCRVFGGDLSSAKTVAAARLYIERELGTVDVLVNNAGEILRPSAWNEQTADGVRRAIEVNLNATIYCIQEFAPGMAERRLGRIVNVSTTYSFNGAAAVLAYTAAKAGVNAVTTAMASELGQYGVLINAVAPGNIDTAMTQAAGVDVIDWAISTTPAGRLGTVDEVADAVLFLASHDFINGHILAVDGGQILKI